MFYDPHVKTKTTGDFALPIKQVSSISSKSD